MACRTNTWCDGEDCGGLRFDNGFIMKKLRVNVRHGGACTRAVEEVGEETGKETGKVKPPRAKDAAICVNTFIADHVDAQPTLLVNNALHSSSGHPAEFVSATVLFAFRVICTLKECCCGVDMLTTLTLSTEH